jgi:hypothetical protein
MNSSRIGIRGSSTALTVEFEGPCEPLLSTLRRQPYVVTAACTQAPDSPLHRAELHVTDLAAARRAVPAVVVAQAEVFVSCRPSQRSLEAIFLDLTQGESGDSTR